MRSLAMLSSIVEPLAGSGVQFVARVGVADVE